MTTYVVSRIRRQLPSTSIGWVVDSRCADIIDTDRLCNDLYVVNRRDWKELRWSASSWVRILRELGRARKRKYEFGLDLHGQLKSALAMKIARPKRRLAIQSNDPIAASLNPVAHPSDKSHWLDCALDILDQLSPMQADATPIMPALSLERESVLRRIRPFSKLVSISTTSSKPDKSYALSQWEEVGKSLQHAGFHVVYVGGPEGVQPSPDAGQSFVGKLSLRETMAVIALSQVHLCADTFTGHLAAAYQIPVVSLFGPTNPTRFRPYSELGTVLQVGQSVEAIQPDEVVQAALEVYDRAFA